jgi:putative tricarboxylic transport membrane protein
VENSVNLLGATVPYFALFTIFVGTLLGLFIGALPGLGPLMGIILMLPIAFHLDPISAMGLLISIYVAGSCGGAISAILLKVPGTPLAAVTLLDGYPMAQKGKAGEAVGLAITASAFGGLISGLVLIVGAPRLAEIAGNFSAPEFFALAITGILAVVVVAKESFSKGILAGLLGVLLSTIGTDPMSNATRFTLGSNDLLGGLGIVPVVVGLFAIPELAEQVRLGRFGGKAKVERLKMSFSSVFTVLRHWPNFLRSSVIGNVIGAIPGAGGVMASFTAYAVAKSASKEGENYGEGAEGGVIASEAANNACCGGALIPTLALAIPGDASAAVLMGALMVMGMQPGPQLFAYSGDLVSGVFAAYFIANVMLLLLGFALAPVFASVLRIHNRFLIPVVLMLSIVGTYVVHSSQFDLWIMFAFGLLGYLMNRLAYPTAPLVIGLVLGPLLEANFRRSLLISDGSLDIFIQRPISASVLVLDVMVLVLILGGWLYKSMKKEPNKIV